MANNKKFAVKNGLLTQNIEFVSPNDANTINVRMLDSDMLSVSGDTGQLFSITDSQTGVIFAVNDISGVPSIEVDDTGTIRFAELFGNVLIGTAVDNSTDKLQVTGNVSATGTVSATTFSGALTGNATTATTLQTARLIGGVSFNGSANINLPGVNAVGNQNTTGSAATLTTARTIGGVSFNGSANINLPGVNAVGNQNTTGSAATLTTARTIGGVSFNGSANINLPGVNAVGNQNTTGTAANVTGTVAIANGGTGATTAAAAINALLPSQVSQSGQFLTTDGTNVSFAAVPAPNNGTLTMNVSGTGLSGSASFTANQAGGSTFTVTTNATSNNTANAVVARNASGNFSAGTVTAALAGNASTATTLQTTRAINGTNFNGSAAITTANWGTARTITIGSTGKSVNGSANVAWTLAEIGAQAAGNYVTTNTTQTISGAKTFSSAITHNAISTRDKYRVWSDSTYTIGMQNNITFGAINNNYAMTFQMSNTDARGFWWGDSSHTTAQGAMALSTNGKLSVAHSVRIGFGEADTVIPGATHRLEVNGSFAATSKSFLIDHPTRPGMKLQYGSLESPYHGVRLTGEFVLTNGVAVVKLPDYIHGLCRQQGAQVQITNIRHGKVIWVEDINIGNDEFTVQCDIEPCDQKEYKFYWSFTAIRKDIEDMEVEIDVS